MNFKIPRIRGKLAKYPSAYAVAGTLIFIAFGLKAGTYSYDAERVESGSAFRGNVTSITSEDCVSHLGSRRRQKLTQTTPCYRLGLDVYPEPNKRVSVEAMAEKDAVGKLEVGDRVFLVLATDGSGKYFVLNERDRSWFFNRQYIWGFISFVGLMLIAVSFLCVAPEAVGAEDNAKSGSK